MSRRTGSTGTVFAFGLNTDGQLGTETENTELTPVPVPALRGMRIVMIAAGWAHSAAVAETGELFTWGRSDHGQCGHGSTRNETQPRLVEGLRGRRVVYVTCGHNHTLCVTDNGDVYAWGLNNHGQLGLGIVGDVAVPKPVDVQRQRVVQIAAGGEHTLILTERGAVYCCGYGRDGRLGLGDTEDRTVPYLLEALNGVVVVGVAAATDSSLVLSADGDLYGFGKGDGGQLGIDPPARHLAPTPVIGLQGRRVVRVSAFGSHSLATTEKGVVYSWGLGDFGQLGHGRGSTLYTPRVIAALSEKRVISVSVGLQHSAIITEDGMLFTSGEGKSGQLGQGSDRMVLVPRAVKTLIGVSVSQAACGEQFTLVLVR